VKKIPILSNKRTNENGSIGKRYGGKLNKAAQVPGAPGPWHKLSQSAFEFTRSLDAVGSLLGRREADNK